MSKVSQKASQEMSRDSCPKQTPRVVVGSAGIIKRLKYRSTTLEPPRANLIHITPRANYKGTKCGGVLRSWLNQSRDESLKGSAGLRVLSEL